MTDQHSSIATTSGFVEAFVSETTGRIILDRPKALNSLSLEMIRDLDKILRAWKDDDAVTQVLITSSSEKAFCSGGDVRAVRDAIVEGSNHGIDEFFSEEYDVNHMISTYPKPYIALVDGIVMGGGFGVSLHGSHRIVTDRAWGSMPEMFIGYITDVGFSYTSQHLAGSSYALGLFLGLTGYRMKTADLAYTGVATHVVSHDDVDALIAAIVSDGVDQALSSLATPAADFHDGPAPLEEMRDAIEATFDFETWEEIDAALSAYGDEEFVAKVRELMVGAAPSSLIAATWLYAANRRVVDLRAALDNELHLGVVKVRDGDFVEGTRAVLVDKSHDAKFNPTPEVEQYRAALK